MHGDLFDAALEQSPRSACPLLDACWKQDPHRITAWSFEESHCDAGVDDPADFEESGHSGIDRECGGGEQCEDDAMDSCEFEYGESVE